MDNVDRIWMPGEMEHQRILERKEKGIPLAPVVIANLNRLAAELNLTNRLE
jgi:LDH2 family malate/lactate/ureidoglycolate dehydrogenase